jgi:hypothetical protein
MTDRENSGKPADKSRKNQREERLAAQLRANLKRRKAGAKGRDAAPGEAKTPPKPDTA